MILRGASFACDSHGLGVAGVFAALPGAVHSCAGPPPEVFSMARTKRPRAAARRQVRGYPLKPERIQSHNVATILGVTPRAVREMALRGVSPSAALIGGRWTFSEDQVRTWLHVQELRHLREACKGPALDQLQIDRAKLDASYKLALGRKPKLA